MQGTAAEGRPPKEEGVRRIREALRQDAKARLELWTPWASFIIGVIGAITGHLMPVTPLGWLGSLLFFGIPWGRLYRPSFVILPAPGRAAVRENGVRLDLP
jgi:hypothetical protein